MRTSIQQLPEWPQFEWCLDDLVRLLAAARLRQDRLLGRMQTLGFPMQDEAVLSILTDDVTTSGGIEGESLDRNQVRSSIARRSAALLQHVGANPTGADRPLRHA
jgi:Fic family protein